MQTIIDAHCHIYPDAIALRAVESVDHFYDHLPSQPYDGTVHALREAGEASGVSRFVVHSVATLPRHVESINHFIAASVRDSNGAFIGLGTLHPDAEDLAGDFETLCSLGLQGVKLHPDIQQFRADSDRAMEIYAMCESHGLPVLIHTGDYRYDYSNPSRIVPILETFPSLRVIGAHFGGWSVWDNAARVLSRYDNLMVDCSSSFYWLGKERTRELIHLWGASRVMYGTDYPLWPMQPELDFLRSLSLSPSEYDLIFHRNAEGLYGLDSPEEDDTHV